MSMDEAGFADKPDKSEEKDKKKARKYQIKVVETTARKHKVETINRNNLAQVLDAYAAEGRVVIALNISRDIGGSYEVVSYKNEPVN